MDESLPPCAFPLLSWQIAQVKTSNVRAMTIGKEEPQRFSTGFLLLLVVEVQLLSACQCSFSNQSADCRRGRFLNRRKTYRCSGGAMWGEKNVFGEQRQP